MKIKRLLKKAVAFVSAMTMTVGMMATMVSADINAIEPDKGNLYIHRYLIDDVANAGLPNDGTEATVPSQAEAVSDIVFKVYKVTFTTTAPASGAVTVDSMVNTTTVTDVNGNEFSVTLANTVTTDSTGTAVSSDLAKGIYLVVEQANDKVASSTAPYLVSVPMTNSTGDGWITDVHTYPKNSDISLTKAVNQTSVDVGDTVTWTINAITGSTLEESVKYDIVDELDTALTYVDGSTVVKGVATNGTETTIASTNYTAAADSSNKFTVSFNTAGRELAATYASVKVTFNTKVNDEILERTAYTVENDATIEFTNKYNQVKTRESNLVKIHSAAVNTVKTNTDSQVLANAKFQIATSEANAKAGNFLKKDADGNVIDYGEDGYDAASVWEVTTNAAGIALFEGIKDYALDGTYLTYYLVETKAPAGYSLIGVPVKAEFTATNSTAATSYTIDVNVVDDEIPVLPMTGGNGTYMYILAGLALILAAGIIMIISRKRQMSKNGK